MALVGTAFTVALFLYGWLMNRKLKKIEKINDQRLIDEKLQKIETAVNDSTIDELIAKNNERYSTKRPVK